MHVECTRNLLNSVSDNEVLVLFDGYPLNSAFHFINVLQNTNFFQFFFGLFCLPSHVRGFGFQLRIFRNILKKPLTNGKLLG